MKKKQEITQDTDTFNYTEKSAYSEGLKNLVMFFQYFGIASMFFVINFAIFFSYLLNTNQISVVRIANSRGESKVSYEKNEREVARHDYLSYAKNNNIAPSKSLMALMSYKNEQIDQSQAKVLGLATKAFAGENTNVAACSFKQGNKLYTNGSDVRLSKADLNTPLCVAGQNISATNFLWNVNGNNSQGDCVDLSSYDISSNVEAFISVDTLGETSACRLLIKRTN